MKILIVITKAEIGGAQVFVLNLAKGLKLAGHQVTVASGLGSFLPEELKKEGIDFYQFKNLKRSFNPLANVNFVKELKAYVAQNSFAVVHLNSSNALLGTWSLRALKLKTGKPKIVFTIHGLSLIDGQHRSFKIIKKVYRYFFKLAFKKLDHIVFVSNNNFNFAKKIGMLNNGLFKKASIIYNGLDFPSNYFFSRKDSLALLRDNLFKNKQVSKELVDDFFTDNAFIYGSIGRLAYPKNYEFLISTFIDLKKEIPQAKLLIIGDGPDREKYQSMMAAYNLNKDIILLGELKEASRFLKVFNLFVLPSVFEGLSLSLIETKFAGVPSLASLVGGNEEIIGKDACFRLNDLEEFIKKAKQIYNNNSEPLILKEEYEEIKFSSKKMIDEYIRLYLR